MLSEVDLGGKKWDFGVWDLGSESNSGFGVKKWKPGGLMGVRCGFGVEKRSFGVIWVMVSIGPIPKMASPVVDFWGKKGSIWDLVDGSSRGLGVSKLDLGFLDAFSFRFGFKK